MDTKSESAKSELGAMISALAESFANERKKSESYKELFGAGSSLTGLLRRLEHKMSMHVLDACEVLDERHGIKVNNEQYHVLMALPLLVKIATKDVERNEGSACSVDKAYFMLSEQLLGLSDKAKGE
jgi:hypothetical protein